jgi:diamine N-acetyltransferase
MTSSEPTFRSFTSTDTDELICMMRELFSSDDVHFDEAMARKGIGAIAASPPGAAPPGRIWMIESNGQSAGYMVLTFAFSLEFGGWHAFIDEVFLREAFRGRGWGTHAIELAASTCIGLGLRALLLEVDVANERALRVYRRCGFLEHRRRLMRRVLSAP